MKMRALVALGATLLAAAPGAAAPTPSPRPTAAPSRLVATDLYAQHVRRLVQNYLRLRLLQLREEDLDRARAVIEGRLPVEVLVPTPAAAREGTTH